MTIDATKRAVFVHAHPDDEVIGTGATLARYAADPEAHVTLVTCTLGEEGEIHVPELAGLAADQADQLGGYRICEWHASCDALGVTDRRMLGGYGRYRDSGMMGTPSNDKDRAFWGVSVRQAAEELVAVLREVRPQVVVTYDPNGFYGHPDHIQAHRVSVEAVRLAADPQVRPDLGEPWKVAKFYWTAMAKSALAEGFETLKESKDNPFADVDSLDDLPFGSDDSQVTTCVVSDGFGQHKLEALRCHATQVPPDNWIEVLAANLGPDSLTSEHYILAEGERGPGTGPHGWESDFFDGIATV